MKYGTWIAAFMAFTAAFPAVSEAGRLWNANNCKDGGAVTDAVCCDDNHCPSLTSKAACNAERTCAWQKESNTCAQHRDRNNFVCCRTGNNELCDEISRGICPDHFQTPTACCEANNTRWDGVLVVTKADHVCCNTPCTDRRIKGCDIPEACSRPGARSLGGHNGGGYVRPAAYQSNYGFNKYYLPNPPSYGQVIPYTGLEYSPAQVPYYPDKPQPVEEITVDDIMESLIQALSNDKGTVVNPNDVFDFSQETYSDSYYGKQRYGGQQLGLNYLPADHAINKIYNPYYYGSLYGNQYGSSYGGPFASPYASPAGPYGQPSSYGYGQQVQPLYQSPYNFGNNPANYYQPSYPQQPGGYPQQPGGYPQQPGGYPQQPGGYPQQPQNAYNQPSTGGDAAYTGSDKKQQQGYPRFL